MRLFQNFGLYPSYRRLFDTRNGTRQTFTERKRAFLEDRFGALHFLAPVLNYDPVAFFTNGDDEILQRSWARENGLPRSASLREILLSQIEAHRTEVFYNIDPMRYGSDFVRRLPGCVRRTLAWRAAPSSGGDFNAYGRLMCNFPRILDQYRREGMSVAYFAPAQDPVMDKYAEQEDRQIDVLFVGGYSRHHKRRADILQAVAALSPRYDVRFHLDRSRLTGLAETPLGHLPALAQHRRPADVRRVSAGPIFGLELYEALSRAKVVLNCAVDMAGDERGNMRCFEAMGCAALMVSDYGRYPDGMRPGENLVTYSGPGDVANILQRALANPEQSRELAQEGARMMRHLYSKEKQWAEFQRIVGEI